MREMRSSVNEDERSYYDSKSVVSEDDRGTIQPRDTKGNTMPLKETVISTVTAIEANNITKSEIITEQLDDSVLLIAEKKFTVTQENSYELHRL